jgi:hypothetical protein
MSLKDELKRLENAPLFEGGESLSHRVTRQDGTTEDFLTGGYGHKMSSEEEKHYPEGTEIPLHIVDRWFNEDFGKAEVNASIQCLDMKVEKLREPLIKVNFQLGSNWQYKFPKAVRALEEGQYKEAANQIMTSSDGVSPSAWARQTPNRAKEFEQAILDLIIDEGGNSGTTNRLREFFTGTNRRCIHT